MANFYIFILIIFSRAVLANEPSQIHFETEINSTSDDHIRKTSKLNYSMNRRNFLWPYQGEREKAQDLGLQYSHHTMDTSEVDSVGNELEAFIAQKRSNSLYWKTALIYHEVKNDGTGDDIKKYLGYKGELSFKSKPIGHLSLQLEDNLIYKKMVLPLGLQKLMTAKSYRLNYLNTNISSSRWRSHIENISYSDGNNATKLDSDYKYHIGKQSQWIWFGAGVNYITFDKSEVGYWTPETFLSYGPRFECSLPLSKEITWALGTNININKEKNSEQGVGYYLNTSLQYGNRNSFHMKFNFEKIQSVQNDNEWNSEQYTFMLVSYI